MAMISMWRFTGKTVRSFDKTKTDLDPAKNIFDLRVEWDDDRSWLDIFSDFLAYPNIEKTTGIVIGNWHKDAIRRPDDIVRALIASRDKLPNITAIYWGDIESEECEMSWIDNPDLSPLLTAYPDLEYLLVRGIGGLSLGSLQHDKLRFLGIESGGLPQHILEEVLNAKLPELTHLELWLGDSYYGFNFGLEALQPLLQGKLFPKLAYLGLCDSEITDEIAQAIVDAPILDQLKGLDLSMGTLGDEGAQALMASEKVRQLKWLIIIHIYCSEAMMDQLNALPISVDLGAWDSRTPKEDRYVQVSE